MVLFCEQQWIVLVDFKWLRQILFGTFMALLAIESLNEIFQEKWLVFLFCLFFRFWTFAKRFHLSNDENFVETKGSPIVNKLDNFRHGNAFFSKYFKNVVERAIVEKSLLYQTVYKNLIEIQLNWIEISIFLWFRYVVWLVFPFITYVHLII